MLLATVSNDYITDYLNNKHYVEYLDGRKSDSLYNNVLYNFKYNQEYSNVFGALIELGSFNKFVQIEYSLIQPHIIVHKSNGKNKSEYGNTNLFTSTNWTVEDFDVEAGVRSIDFNNFPLAILNIITYHKSNSKIDILLDIVYDKKIIRIKKVS